MCPQPHGSGSCRLFSGSGGSGTPRSQLSMTVALPPTQEQASQPCVVVALSSERRVAPCQVWLELGVFVGYLQPMPARRKQGQEELSPGFFFLLLPVYILPSLLTRGLTPAHRPEAACSPSLHCSVHPTLLGSPQSWSLCGDRAVLPAVTLQQAAASVCPQGKLLPLGPNFSHHQLLQKTTNNSWAGAPCSCYFSSHLPVGAGASPKHLEVFNAAHRALIPQSWREHQDGHCWPCSCLGALRCRAALGGSVGHRQRCAAAMGKGGFCCTFFLSVGFIQTICDDE